MTNNQYLNQSVNQSNHQNLGETLSDAEDPGLTGGLKLQKSELSLGLSHVQAAETRDNRGCTCSILTVLGLTSSPCLFPRAKNMLRPSTSYKLVPEKSRCCLLLQARELAPPVSAPTPPLGTILTSFFLMRKLVPPHACV